MVDTYNYISRDVQ
ncbi:unnamed protein product, partial [Rotaria socialis]